MLQVALIILHVKNQSNEWFQEVFVLFKVKAQLITQIEQNRK